MLQRNTSELVAGLDDAPQAGRKLSFDRPTPQKIMLFSPFQACSSSILMADPLESALRNCNAAPQNGSNASANWPQLKEL
jgi:hypothetical protein